MIQNYRTMDLVSTLQKKPHLASNDLACLVKRLQHLSKDAMKPRVQRLIYPRISELGMVQSSRIQTFSYGTQGSPLLSHRQGGLSLRGPIPYNRSCQSFPSFLTRIRLHLLSSISSMHPLPYPRSPTLLTFSKFAPSTGCILLCH